MKFFKFSALTAAVKASNTVKNLCVVIVLSFLGCPVYGQHEKSGLTDQRVYLGLGFGFDYGGFGGKIEYFPVHRFGVFGGAGYNFISAGWNVGATYRILGEKTNGCTQTKQEHQTRLHKFLSNITVSPNVALFYGYNGGVAKIENAPEYEMNSYGVTVGAQADIMMGCRGNKLTVGLFVPIRSKKFMDNYRAMKDDPYVNLNSKLMPVTFSVGYSFVFKI